MKWQQANLGRLEVPNKLKAPSPSTHSHTLHSNPRPSKRQASCDDLVGDDGLMAGWHLASTATQSLPDRSILSSCMPFATLVAVHCTVCMYMLSVYSPREQRQDLARGQPRARLRLG
jgi:hypothetical protein